MSTLPPVVPNYPALGLAFLAHGHTFALAHLSGDEQATTLDWLNNRVTDAGLGQFVAFCAKFLQSDEAREALGLDAAGKQAAHVMSEVLGVVLPDARPHRTGFFCSFPLLKPFGLHHGQGLGMRKVGRDARYLVEHRGQRLAIVHSTYPNGNQSVRVFLYGSGTAAEEASSNWFQSETPDSWSDLDVFLPA